VQILKELERRIKIELVRGCNEEGPTPLIDINLVRRDIVNHGQRIAGPLKKLDTALREFEDKTNELGCVARQSAAEQAVLCEGRWRRCGWLHARFRVQPLPPTPSRGRPDEPVRCQEAEKHIEQVSELFDIQLGAWFDQLAGTSTGGLLSLYCASVPRPVLLALRSLPSRGCPCLLSPYGCPALGNVAGPHHSFACLHQPIMLLCPQSQRTKERAQSARGCFKITIPAGTSGRQSSETTAASAEPRQRRRSAFTSTRVGGHCAGGLAASHSVARPCASANTYKSTHLHTPARSTQARISFRHRGR
jgi:hypothetical protein